MALADLIYYESQTYLSAKVAQDPNINAVGTAIEAAAKTIRHLRVENGAGSQDVHLKVFDTSAISVGTSVPDFIVRARAGKIVEIIPLGGVAFAAALEAACTTEPGTAGTTSPTAAVLGQLAYS